MIHSLVIGYSIYLNLIWLENETWGNYVVVESLSKIVVMAHGSSKGSDVNNTKKTKKHLFLGMQFIRQTIPSHVQLSLSMKGSGIIIVMDHVERN